MKRLVQKTRLKFFQDDANGEWGVTHIETYDTSGTPFNAFWNGIGMIHDVFEHQHEFTNKYFRGDYAMNIGGEIAAMGKMWYYQNGLGLGSYRRINPQNIYTDAENMIGSTESEVEEAIKYGNCNYGDTLESCVPCQKPLNDDGELDYQVREYAKRVKKWTLYKEKHESYEESSLKYKQSVTFRKIADLHRWGYREAERLVPNNWTNRSTLIDFISFWNDFCKNNPAEDLARIFKELVFYIYREDDKISWKAKLISGDYMIRNVPIKNVYNVMEELYEYEN